MPHHPLSTTTGATVVSLNPPPVEATEVDTIAFNACGTITSHVLASVLPRFTESFVAQRRHNPLTAAGFVGTMGAAMEAEEACVMPLWVVEDDDGAVMHADRQAKIHVSSRNCTNNAKRHVSRNRNDAAMGRRASSSSALSLETNTDNAANTNKNGGGGRSRASVGLVGSTPPNRRFSESTASRRLSSQQQHHTPNGGDSAHMDANNNEQDDDDDDDDDDALNTAEDGSDVEEREEDLTQTIANIVGDKLFARQKRSSIAAVLSRMTSHTHDDDGDDDRDDGDGGELNPTHRQINGTNASEGRTVPVASAATASPTVIHTGTCTPPNSPQRHVAFDEGGFASGGGGGDERSDNASDTHSPTTRRRRQSADYHRQQQPTKDHHCLRRRRPLCPEATAALEIRYIQYCHQVVAQQQQHQSSQSQQCQSGQSKQGTITHSVPTKRAAPVLNGTTTNAFADIGHGVVDSSLLATASANASMATAAPLLAQEETRAYLADTGDSGAQQQRTTTAGEVVANEAVASSPSPSPSSSVPNDYAIVPLLPYVSYTVDVLQKRVCERIRRRFEVKAVRHQQQRQQQQQQQREAERGGGGGGGGGEEHANDAWRWMAEEEEGEESAAALAAAVGVVGSVQQLVMTIISEPNYDLEIDLTAATSPTNTTINTTISSSLPSAAMPRPPQQSQQQHHQHHLISMAGGVDRYLSAESVREVTAAVTEAYGKRREKLLVLLMGEHDKKKAAAKKGTGPDDGEGSRETAAAERYAILVTPPPPPMGRRSDNNPLCHDDADGGGGGGPASFSSSSPASPLLNATTTALDTTTVGGLTRDNSDIYGEAAFGAFSFHSNGYQVKQYQEALQRARASVAEEQKKTMQQSNATASAAARPPTAVEAFGEEEYHDGDGKQKEGDVHTERSHSHKTHQRLFARMMSDEVDRVLLRLFNDHVVLKGYSRPQLSWHDEGNKCHYVFDFASMTVDIHRYWYPTAGGAAAASLASNQNLLSSLAGGGGGDASSSSSSSPNHHHSPSSPLYCPHSHNHHGGGGGTFETNKGKVVMKDKVHIALLNEQFALAKARMNGLMDTTVSGVNDADAADDGVGSGDSTKGEEKKNTGGNSTKKQQQQRNHRIASVVVDGRAYTVDYKYMRMALAVASSTAATTTRPSSSHSNTSAASPPMLASIAPSPLSPEGEGACGGGEGSSSSTSNSNTNFPPNAAAAALLSMSDSFGTAVEPQLGLANTTTAAGGSNRQSTQEEATTTTALLLASSASTSSSLDLLRMNSTQWYTITDHPHHDDDGSSGKGIASSAAVTRSSSTALPAAVAAVLEHGYQAFIAQTIIHVTPPNQRVLFVKFSSSSSSSSKGRGNHHHRHHGDEDAALLDAISDVHFSATGTIVNNNDIRGGRIVANTNTNTSTTTTIAGGEQSASSNTAVVVPVHRLYSSAESQFVAKRLGKLKKQLHHHHHHSHHHHHKKSSSSSFFSRIAQHCTNALDSSKDWLSDVVIGEDGSSGLLGGLSSLLSLSSDQMQHLKDARRKFLLAETETEETGAAVVQSRAASGHEEESSAATFADAYTHTKKTRSSVSINATSCAAEGEDDRFSEGHSAPVVGVGSSYSPPRRRCSHPSTAVTFSSAGVEEQFYRQTRHYPSIVLSGERHRFPYLLSVFTYLVAYKEDKEREGALLVMGNLQQQQQQRQQQRGGYQQSHQNNSAGAGSSSSPLSSSSANASSPIAVWLTNESNSLGGIKMDGGLFLTRGVGTSGGAAAPETYLTSTSTSLSSFSRYGAHGIRYSFADLKQFCIEMCLDPVAGIPSGHIKTAAKVISEYSNAIINRDTFIHLYLNARREKAAANTLIRKVNSPDSYDHRRISRDDREQIQRFVLQLFPQREMDKAVLMDLLSKFEAARKAVYSTGSSSNGGGSSAVAGQQQGGARASNAVAGAGKGFFARIKSVFVSPSSSFSPPPHISTTADSSSSSSTDLPPTFLIEYATVLAQTAFDVVSLFIYVPMLICLVIVMVAGRGTAAGRHDAFAIQQGLQTVVNKQPFNPCNESLFCDPSIALVMGTRVGNDVGDDVAPYQRVFASSNYRHDLYGVLGSFIPNLLWPSSPSSEDQTRMKNGDADDGAAVTAGSTLIASSMAPIGALRIRQHRMLLEHARNPYFPNVTRYYAAEDRQGRHVQLNLSSVSAMNTLTSKDDGRSSSSSSFDGSQYHSCLDLGSFLTDYLLYPQTGCGGYVVDIPFNTTRQQYLSIAEQMVSALWIDLATRDLVFEYYLFHINSGMVVTVNHLVSLSPGGGARIITAMAPFHLPIASASNASLWAFVPLVLLSVALFAHLYLYYSSMSSLTGSQSTAAEVTVNGIRFALLVFVFVSYRRWGWISLAPDNSNSDSGDAAVGYIENSVWQTTHYPNNYESMFIWYDLSNTINCCALGLTAALAFYSTRNLSGFSVLVKTLFRSLPGAVYLGFIFITVLVGLSLCATITFGYVYEDYRSVQDSMLTLLAVWWGDWDFTAMLATSDLHAFGYLFIIFFHVFFVMFLLSALTALYTDAYITAHTKRFSTEDLVRLVGTRYAKVPICHANPRRGPLSVLRELQWGRTVRADLRDLCESGGNIGGALGMTVSSSSAASSVVSPSQTAGGGNAPAPSSTDGSTAAKSVLVTRIDAAARRAHAIALASITFPRGVHNLNNHSVSSSSSSSSSSANASATARRRRIEFFGTIKSQYFKSACDAQYFYLSVMLFVLIPQSRYGASGYSRLAAVIDYYQQYQSLSAVEALEEDRNAVADTMVQNILLLRNCTPAAHQQQRGHNSSNPSANQKANGNVNTSSSRSSSASGAGATIVSVPPSTATAFPSSSAAAATTVPSHSHGEPVMRPPTIIVPSSVPSRSLNTRNNATPAAAEVTPPNATTIGQTPMPMEDGKPKMKAAKVVTAPPISYGETVALLSSLTHLQRKAFLSVFLIDHNHSRSSSSAAAAAIARDDGSDSGNSSDGSSSDGNDDFDDGDFDASALVPAVPLDMTATVRFSAMAIAKQLQTAKDNKAALAKKKKKKEVQRRKEREQQQQQQQQVSSGSSSGGVGGHPAEVIGPTTSTARGDGSRRRKSSSSQCCPMVVTRSVFVNCFASAAREYEAEQNAIRDQKKKKTASSSSSNDAIPAKASAGLSIFLPSSSAPSSSSPSVVPNTSSSAAMMMNHKMTPNAVAHRIWDSCGFGRDAVLIADPNSNSSNEAQIGGPHDGAHDDDDDTADDAKMKAFAARRQQQKPFTSSINLAASMQMGGSSDGGLAALPAARNDKKSRKKSVQFATFVPSTTSASATTVASPTARTAPNNNDNAPTHTAAAAPNTNALVFDRRVLHALATKEFGPQVMGCAFGIHAVQRFISYCTEGESARVPVGPQLLERYLFGGKAKGRVGGRRDDDGAAEEHDALDGPIYISPEEAHFRAAWHYANNSSSTTAASILDDDTLATIRTVNPLLDWRLFVKYCRYEHGDSNKRATSFMRVISSNLRRRHNSVFPFYILGGLLAMIFVAFVVVQCSDQTIRMTVSHRDLLVPNDEVTDSSGVEDWLRNVATFLWAGDNNDYNNNANGDSADDPTPNDSGPTPWQYNASIYATNHYDTNRVVIGDANYPVGALRVVQYRVVGMMDSSSSQLSDVSAAGGSMSGGGSSSSVANTAVGGNSEVSDTCASIWQRYGKGYNRAARSAVSASSSSSFSSSSAYPSSGPASFCAPPWDSGAEASHRSYGVVSDEKNNTPSPPLPPHSQSIVDSAFKYRTNGDFGAKFSSKLITEHVGVDGTYSAADGFYFDIPFDDAPFLKNVTAVMAVLEAIFERGWIDHQTRLVGIYLVSYNHNLQSTVLVRTGFEMLSGTFLTPFSHVDITDDMFHSRVPLLVLSILILIVGVPYLLALFKDVFVRVYDALRRNRHHFSEYVTRGSEEEEEEEVLGEGDAADDAENDEAIFAKSSSVAYSNGITRNNRDFFSSSSSDDDSSDDRDSCSVDYADETKPLNTTAVGLSGGNKRRRRKSRCAEEENDIVGGGETNTTTTVEVNAPPSPTKPPATAATERHRQATAVQQGRRRKRSSRGLIGSLLSAIPMPNFATYRVLKSHFVEFVYVFIQSIVVGLAIFCAVWHLLPSHEPFAEPSSSSSLLSASKSSSSPPPQLTASTGGGLLTTFPETTAYGVLENTVVRVVTGATAFCLMLLYTIYFTVGMQFDFIINIIKIAAPDLATITFVFSVVILCFSAAMQLLFGAGALADASQYGTTALYMFMAATSGEGVTDDTFAVRRVTGPLFQVAFVTCTIVVLCNTIIGIIQNAIGEARAQFSSEVSLLYGSGNFYTPPFSFGGWFAHLLQGLSVFTANWLQRHYERVEALMGVVDGGTPQRVMMAAAELYMLMGPEMPMLTTAHTTNPSNSRGATAGGRSGGGGGTGASSNPLSHPIASPLYSPLRGATTAAAGSSPHSPQQSQQAHRHSQDDDHHHHTHHDDEAIIGSFLNSFVLDGTVKARLQAQMAAAAATFRRMELEEEESAGASRVGRGGRSFIFEEEGEEKGPLVVGAADGSSNTLMPPRGGTAASSYLPHHQGRSVMKRPSGNLVDPSNPPSIDTKDVAAAAAAASPATPAKMAISFNTALRQSAWVTDVQSEDDDDDDDEEEAKHQNGGGRGAGGGPLPFGRGGNDSYRRGPKRSSNLAGGSSPPSSAFLMGGAGGGSAAVVGGSSPLGALESSYLDFDDDLTCTLDNQPILQQFFAAQAQQFYAIGIAPKEEGMRRQSTLSSATAMDGGGAGVKKSGNTLQPSATSASSAFPHPPSSSFYHPFLVNMRPTSSRPLRFYSELRRLPLWHELLFNTLQRDYSEVYHLFVRIPSEQFRGRLGEVFLAREVLAEFHRFQRRRAELE